MNTKMMTLAVRALTKAVESGAVGKSSGPAAVARIRDEVLTEILTQDDTITLQEADEAATFAFSVGDLVASYMRVVLG